MYEIPTMDQWFQLTRRFPQYKTVGITLLKDYGYMRSMAFIQDRLPQDRSDRILEFGFGFNPQGLRLLQDKYEVWGADRDQNLHYFRGRDWEADFKQKVGSACPNVNFVRTLLGVNEENTKNIPENYFDIIYSISVLEEVHVSVLNNIVEHASRLLKPGGWLIGTHDLLFRKASIRIPQYFDIHESHGLNIGDRPKDYDFDYDNLLFENPGMVMLGYQSGVAEEQRVWQGHWGVLFTAAQKTR